MAEESGAQRATIGALQGRDNEVLLTLAAVLRAGEQMKRTDAFGCCISTEVLAAGKFDDLIVRNTFPDGRPVALYIQAKRTRHGKPLSWDDLTVQSKAKEYAFVTYFTSFLEIKESLLNQYYLILCTNLDLANDIKELFEPTTLPETCDMFSPLGATCYRFAERNQRTAIRHDAMTNLLKECNECYSLAKVLALCIYRQTALDLAANNKERPNAALLMRYKHAITRSIVGARRANDKAVFEVQESFVTGSELSENQAKFRTMFEAAYKTLTCSEDGVWDDVKRKGIQVKLSGKQSSDASDTAVEFPEAPTLDEDIALFFSKFVLVCNADALSSKIKQALAHSPVLDLPAAQRGVVEIETAFHSLYTTIHDWMKKQSNLPAQLSENDVGGIIQKSNLRLQYLVLKSVSDEYVAKLTEYGLCVKADRLQGLPLHAFLTTETAPSSITFDSCYESWFASCVVLQTIQLCTSNKEFLFVDAVKYREKKKSYQDMLRSLDFPLLLVIVCEGEEESSLVVQLEREMSDALHTLQQLQSRAGTKVVIVAQFRASSDTGNDRAENSLRLQHLADGSLERIIPAYASATLFGTDVSLRSVMKEQDDVRMLLDVADTKQRTKLEHNLTEMHYRRIQAWYIERDFSIQESPPTANASAGEPRDLLTHYMEWDLSTGTINFAEFVSCFDTAEQLNSETPEDTEKHWPGSSSAAKVHIILDKPGFGKTTYLSWLGFHLQRSDRSRWVIRFNSVDYSTDFRRLSEGLQDQPKDDTQALRILYQMVHLSIFVRNINHQKITETDRERERAEQCASLLQFARGTLVVDESRWMLMKWPAMHLILARFFTDQFNAQRLVVLFDGFDEVAPYYKEVVCDLLSRVEQLEGISKLYITSRPYLLREEFEKVFQRVVFYRLKPFSGDNIRAAVHMYLKTTFEPYGGCAEANLLLKGLTSTIKHYLGTLSQAPLFIRMALDVLKPSIAAHVDFAGGTLQRAFFDGLEANFEQLTLIETFVHNKMFKANVEKTRSIDSAIDIARARSNLEKLKRHTVKMHSVLAFRVLFNREERRGLLLDEEQVLEYLDEVNGGDESSGIIEAVVGDQPIFIHRTFAEYFTALWLYRNRGHEKVSDFMRSFPYWEWSRAYLRLFVNKMIAKESGRLPVHLAVVEGSSKDVNRMLQENQHLLHFRDVGGRSILHLMVIYFDSFYLELSLEVMRKLPLFNVAYLVETDTILQWSPLDYALIALNEDKVRVLLQFGATIDRNQLVEVILMHDEETILRKAVQYGSFLLGITKVRTVIRKALEQLCAELQRRVADCLINTKKIALHHPLLADAGISVTPLEYCARHDDAAMFAALVNHAGGFEHGLGGRTEPFVVQAFESNAIDMLHFLIAEGRCDVPPIVDDGALYRVLEECVRRASNQLFLILFELYCHRKYLEYIEDQESAWASCSGRDIDAFSYAYNFIAEREDLLPDAGIDTHIFHLLQKSLAHANQIAAKALIQVARLDVHSLTYPFIVACMKECKIKSLEVHYTCEETLIVLIDRTSHLRAEDEHGKTLLHIALENNCFLVAKHLVQKEVFPLHQADRKDGWNAFHYCVMKQSTIEKSSSLIQHERDSRATFFEDIMNRDPFDCITPRDAAGRNVLHLAVINFHSKLAGFILNQYLNNQAPNAEPSKRRTLLEDVLLRSNLAGHAAYESFMLTFW